MTIHRHGLGGCAPEPLAHYLKALGILRLVAEQADPDVRGAWQDEAFVLYTTLDREALCHFFLEEYRPTPLVAPWNGGSGFFPKDKKTGVDAIRDAGMPRFEQYQDALAAASALTEGMRESPKDDEKCHLLSRARQSWRQGLREWLDAAIVIDASLRPMYPSLLGTGGNDGRLDFTNNFMQRLTELFGLAGKASIAPSAAGSLLRQALFGEAASGLVAKKSSGQFMPGGIGGANSTTGPDGESLLNHWDFVLMLEGTILFSASATRRMAAGAAVQASAPFAVRSHAAGFSSASAAEESARGEQWMPLWDRPMRLVEIRRLLAEGRAQVGRSPAHRPLDMARAISRLGVARGLSGFQRFGYLERNGQANLAVPLGRIAVQARPMARLIDDIAPWLDSLHRRARDKDATARLVAAERKLADAVFHVLTRDATPGHWQALLSAMAGMEGVLASGSGFAAGPIPRLTPGWIDAADDGTPCFRLALALGSAAKGYTREGKPFGSVRRHWLPLAKNGFRFAISGSLATQKLDKTPDRVCHGRDPVDDCLALLGRRLLDAEQAGRTLPLFASRGADAQPADLAALVAGEVDLEDTVLLARAFMALDWERFAAAPRACPRLPATLPDEPWVALRLSLLPYSIMGDMAIPADPAILRRLEAGDAASAVGVALRRLNACGLRPGFAAASTGSARARLWGAALAFPISRRTAQWLAHAINPVSMEKEVAGSHGHFREGGQ